VRNFRPEFAQDIVTNIESKAVPHSAGCVPNAVWIAGVVNVAQSSSTRGSQPLRIVEHARSVFVVGHEEVPGWPRAPVAFGLGPKRVKKGPPR